MLHADLELPRWCLGQPGLNGPISTSHCNFSSPVLVRPRLMLLQASTTCHHTSWPSLPHNHMHVVYVCPICMHGTSGTNNRSERQPRKIRPSCAWHSAADASVSCAVDIGDLTSYATQIPRDYFSLPFCAAPPGGSSASSAPTGLGTASSSSTRQGLKPPYTFYVGVRPARHHRDSHAISTMHFINIANHCRPALALCPTARSTPGPDNACFLDHAETIINRSETVRK